MTDEQIEKAARDYASFEKGGKCYPNYAVECACRRAFIDGAQYALSQQWISVEERLPEPHEEVLTYTIDAIDENAVAYYDGEDWYTTHGEHIRPHYWMPIPQLNPEKQSI